MKKIKQWYIVPIVIASVVALFLIWIFFPQDYYVKALLTVFVPATILIIGFRINTHQRIKIIRNQLYQIFQTLEEFDVDEPKKVRFEKSPFPIFNELNEYLIELIDRIRSNYQANKQFTQNASHELQTPLAIIKGHAELLLQSSKLREKEMESLAAILQNTNRLSKLNSALILLSKIEHQRFSDAKLVNFNEVTGEVLKNFRDLIQIQEIEIRPDLKEIFEVEMSSTLAEILVANLVQNAIRHNTGNFISIQIQKDYFRISNAGKALNGSKEKLFKRFRRESEAEESLGLGLAIVKRICEQFNLQVSYEMSEGLHSLKLTKI